MRKAAKRIIAGAVALLTAWCLLAPAPKAEAAKITRAEIRKLDYSTPSYLVAGETYYVNMESDKANSTSVEFMRLEYSVNGGAVWVTVPLSLSPEQLLPSFSLPPHTEVTSVLLRVSAYFDPLLGNTTYSEKTLGPYKVLLPLEASDLTATPNDDGTVTLRWLDNTNMESYYRITRDGPEGRRTFDVTDTTDSFGPLSFTDKQTNLSKSTVYVYAVQPIVDRYDEPLGMVWATVKTKVPLKLSDKYKVENNVDLSDLITPKDKYKVLLDDTILADSVEKFLNDHKVKPEDVVKKAASGVKLDQTSLTLKKGESGKLTAKVAPDDAANKTVAWSSDNNGIAVVDSAGNVTGISPGIAKITVTTEIGHFTSVCMVTVQAEPPAPADPVVAFPDVAGHPAKAEITKAVAMGVASGYPDGTFRPNGKVTRAEFASMLMRGIETDVPGSPLTFKDKDKIGGWAVPAVQKAVQLGIVNGYEDGTFRPNANITHAEMISMVMRASGLPTDNAPAQTGFADDAELPKWVRPAASKAEVTGIIIVGGLPNGKFAPQALTTRAEAASAIVRMFEAIAVDAE